MMQSAAKSGRPVLHLDYEDILTSPDQTFERVLVFLGEPKGTAGVTEGELVPVPQKPAGDLAQRLRQRFLNFATGSGWYAQPRDQRLPGKPA